MARHRYPILAAFVGSALALVAAPVCAQQQPLLQPLEIVKVKPVKAPHLFKVSDPPAVREVADRHVRDQHY